MINVSCLEHLVVVLVIPVVLRRLLLTRPACEENNDNESKLTSELKSIEVSI